MLNTKDVRQVGIHRFWRTGIWQYRDWFLGLSAIWLIVMVIVAAAILCNMVPETRVAYTIPSSIVEGGKDISIVSEKWVGYTVNGYLLKFVAGDPSFSTVYWLLMVIAIIPVLVAFIVDIVGDSKASKYADDLVQKWVDTKEV
jgi:hypothetical protein